MLQRLANYVEKAVKLRQAVRSALVYPTAVISTATVIVAGLLKWVVPIFANLFAGLDVTLPIMTRIVISLSEVVGKFGWALVLLLIVLAVAIKYARTTPQGRLFFDNLLLKLPVLGQILRKIAVARFTRTLGTL